MLRRYDRSALDREAQLSYDTLEYFLGIQVEGDAWRQHDFPVNQVSGVQSNLPNFMTPPLHRLFRGLGAICRTPCVGVGLRERSVGQSGPAA